MDRPYVDEEDIQKKVGLGIDFVGVLRELKKALQFAAAGLGLIQVGEYYAYPWLESGELVEVLADYRAHAYDISVVFQRRKQIAPRLRVFIDFLVDLFDPSPWSSQSEYGPYKSDDQ